MADDGKSKPKGRIGEITRFKARNGPDRNNLTRERGTSRPKGPRERPRRKRTTPEPIRPSTYERERKYQAIKLAKSGRSLREIKAFMKTGTAHLTDEYVGRKDLNALSQLAYGLKYLELRRPQGREILKMRFPKRPPMRPNREEYIANFLIDGRIPIDWKRDGNLIRKGPPNASQPGSSEGKMKTIVKGAQKTNRAFKRLIGTLKGIAKAGKGSRRNVVAWTKAIEKAIKIDT